MDVFTVDVLGGGFDGLRGEARDGCFAGGWRVGSIGEGDLAILVFGDVWVVGGAGNLVGMSVLLVGLIGRC